MMLGTILLVFAFVLSFCAALGWPAVPPRHLGWAAFCCYIASLLFSDIGRLLH
jgi:hypothetical protein